MILRSGNLVRHKSGGPIIVVDDVVSRERVGRSSFVRDARHDCTWLENGIKRVGSFRPSELQCVHADGTPRNYDEEA
jgi:uncharacterized protein YodC (DUF2158 family)